MEVQKTTQVRIKNAEFTYEMKTVRISARSNISPVVGSLTRPSATPNFRPIANSRSRP